MRNEPSQPLADGPASSRAELAARQRNFIRAMTGEIDPPSGFVRDHLQRAAESLRHKRRRTFARAYPALVEALAESFPRCFDSFAASQSLTANGVTEDAERFVRWLIQNEPLSVGARVQCAMTRAQRGWPIRSIMARQPLRLVIAARISMRRVVVFDVPLWF